MFRCLLGLCLPGCCACPGPGGLLSFILFVLLTAGAVYLSIGALGSMGPEITPSMLLSALSA